MKSKNWNKEEFVKNYQQLKSSRKMAELYNCNRNTITAFAKKIGYDYSNNKEIKITAVPPEQIIQLYNEVKNCQVIAKQYNCSGTSVRNYLISLGVDLKNINVVDSLKAGKFANYEDLIRVNDYTLIIPTLKAGESKTLTFTYVVDKDTKETSITNKAEAIETTHSLKVEDSVKVEITKPIIEKLPEIVQTGDNAPIVFFIGMAFLAFLGMCVVTLVSSKKRR